MNVAPDVFDVDPIDDPKSVLDANPVAGERYDWAMMASSMVSGTTGLAEVDDTRRTSVVQINPDDRDMLRLLAAGKATSELADRLNVSESDLPDRLNVLFETLGVRTTEQAVAEGRRRRLLV